MSTARVRCGRGTRTSDQTLLEAENVNPNRPDVDDLTLLGWAAAGGGGMKAWLSY